MTQQTEWSPLDLAIASTQEAARRAVREAMREHLPEPAPEEMRAISLALAELWLAELAATDMRIGSPAADAVTGAVLSVRASHVRTSARMIADADADLDGGR
ncbi:hypothetical protein [Roseospira navarrensis]|uniref:Uncharacterized protein n=1 Tax=Roseospira navarrensis TaxID=140058 RepID=A0A7X1ZG94_9PROT|nr:hypothetical protein [Roseospira navarrensis]MQX36842.1 hypothetical protein [Roseospira navarrensis]